jgi:hypothetical protein
MHPAMHPDLRSHSSKEELEVGRSNNEKLVDEELGAAVTISRSDLRSSDGRAPSIATAPESTSESTHTSPTGDLAAAATTRRPSSYIGSSQSQIKLRSRTSVSDATYSTTSVAKGKDYLNEEKDKSIKVTYWKTLSDAWVQSHWPIFLVSFLIFLVLAGAGIALYLVVTQSEERQRSNAMSDLALETGAWFAKELDFAILPLFSMAQFATELEIFANLPDQIKSPGEKGALPFMPQGSDSKKVYRNVTGVCDQPALIERFIEIASAVKRNANMDGILQNIQLAPQGTSSIRA